MRWCVWWAGELACDVLTSPALGADAPTVAASTTCQQCTCDVIERSSAQLVNHLTLQRHTRLEWEFVQYTRRYALRVLCGMYLCDADGRSRELVRKRI